jgi:AraC-like DNA-binding protein
MLHMLPRFLERRGASSAYVFSRAGLKDPMDLAPTRIVTRAQISELLGETAHVLGDPLAGPHIVFDGIDPIRLGLTGRALLAGPTIYECLLGHARHMPALQSNVRLDLKVQANKAYWSLDFVGADPERMWVLAEGAITLVLQIIRRTLGSRWSPICVHFPHRPRTSIDRYECLFETQVRFGRGRASVVIFDAQTLARRALPSGSSEYLPIDGNSAGSDDAEALSDPLYSSDQLVDVVSNVIDGMLMTSDVGLPRAARVLGYPPRTLQRTLARIGTSFEAIVEARRRALATDLLNDSSLSVANIAMAVGYSDSAHFIRAFHRWNRETPTEFRRKCARAQRSAQSDQRRVARNGNSASQLGR